MAPPFRTTKRWMTKRVVPDYTNQLDLFSEAEPKRRRPATAASPFSAFQHRLQPPEQMRFHDLVPLPPEDTFRTPAPTLARATTDRNGRVPQQLLFQAGERPNGKIAIVVIGNAQWPVLSRYVDKVVTAVDAATPGRLLKSIPLFKLSILGRNAANASASDHRSFFQSQPLSPSFPQ